MSARVIDRADWTDYVDAFSRRHDGWLVSVAVESGSAARKYVSRDMPLRGVVAESHDGADALMLFTGDATPHAAHIVGHATALEVDETSEGAEAALTITDQSGARTILEFRSAVPPELVDGIA